MSVNPTQPTPNPSGGGQRPGAPLNATSAWLASFVALLVGLGTQVLLESVIPVGLGGPGSDAHITMQSMWVADAAIRFVSFAMGGLVAVRLAQALTIRLAILLVIVAILGTVFVQFPSARMASVWIAVWFASAPLGILVGAWVARAKRSAA